MQPLRARALRHAALRQQRGGTRNQPEHGGAPPAPWAGPRGSYAGGASGMAGMPGPEPRHCGSPTTLA
eukprot:5562275-Alexandrium_andersonii.AAC.1